MQPFSLLELLDTLGFIFLGVAAVYRWRQRRDQGGLYLALALGSLGVVSVLGRINEATGYEYSFFGPVNIVTFLASGYFLLMFRHSLLPLSKPVRLLASGSATASAIFAIAVRLPNGPRPEYTSAQTAALLAVVILWAIYVGEPSIRFWVASKDLPVVQKARLRALGTGYFGIILILLVAFAQGPGFNERAQTFINVFILALVPILYVSFAPPKWLRQAWRGREEESLRITHDLAVFAPDMQTMAERGLDRALRLVGADSGFIQDRNGEVLARRGDPGEPTAELLSESRSDDGTAITRVEGDSVRTAVVVPLGAESGTGFLCIVSGPFTPLFGSDEILRLREYASVLGVALDRVRLVEALAGETERYQALLQSVSDVGEGFVITEAGRCVYANDAYCRMSGYTLDELRRLPTLIELALPDEREEIAERLRRRLGGEDISEHYEAILVRKDRTIRHTEVALKVLKSDEGQRIVSIIRDVTDRKVAEEALRQKSEAVQLLQSVAVAANEAVEVDDALQAALDAICTYSGWPIGHALLPDEFGHLLRSAHIWHLVDPVRFSTFKEVSESQRFTKGNGLPGRVWETGRPTWVSDVSEDPTFERGRADTGVSAGFAFPILIGREVVGVLEFFSENVVEPNDGLLDVVTSIGAQLGRVVERKRNETLRNEFISNAAHELRTPITAIVGFSSILADPEAALPPDELNASIRALYRQGERLRALVDNLLDFTRMQQRPEVELAPLRVADVLNNVVEVVPTPRGKSIKVEAPPSVEVMADRLRLEQIVTNLVVNAYRYGGSNITIRAEPNGETVAISVTDDGQGVPKALLGKLFEPFTRGEDSAGIGGSGLGLAIVRMLAAAQGGEVEYHGEDGGGANFVVKLARA
ncbi:MAG TPA: ATP-binding protein [Actinomycetota bacterium]|nr:ATP-binding protein [Actinomycetota bacterium]